MDIETSNKIVDEKTLAGIYKALSEPNRVRVVRALLQEEEMTCGQLTSLLGVSASTFSHHIAELIECGLVSKRKEGRHHILSVRRDILIKYAPAII
jgi:DNA-binding transcriptional ArsR family regulator